MPRIDPRALAVAVLVAAAAVAAPARSEAAAPPSVGVAPNTELVDFQQVQLTGTGFDGYTLLEWFQCRGGAVDENDCDGYNADFISVDPAGNVSDTIYVDARIYLPDGTEVDCRTDPAGCEVGVGFMMDADEWPEVALDFDPDAPLRPPVTATVTPDLDLLDGQRVALRGENLSNRRGHRVRPTERTDGSTACARTAHTGPAATRSRARRRGPRLHRLSPPRRRSAARVNMASCDRASRAPNRRNERAGARRDQGRGPTEHEPAGPDQDRGGPSQGRSAGQEGTGVG
jgi:hypothetical protein